MVFIIIVLASILNVISVILSAISSIAIDISLIWNIFRCGVRGSLARDFFFDFVRLPKTMSRATLEGVRATSKGL